MLQQVEITVYLAPGFEPSSGDATDPSPFDLSKLTDATSDQRRMYRWWIADECGDGHYNMLNSEWVTDKPIDFSPVFPEDDDGNATYVDRYRPGSSTLISRDVDSKPLKAVLEIAQGYYSEDPELEDPEGSAGWVTIPYGHGWRLLDDRLGIEITADKPDAWTTGAEKTPDGTTPAIPKVSTILWTATPTQETAFLLRLTTVIEADQRIGIPNTSTANAVTALMRDASPTDFARERSIDGTIISSIARSLLDRDTMRPRRTRTVTAPTAPIRSWSATTRRRHSHTPSSSARLTSFRRWRARRRCRS